MEFKRVGKHAVKCILTQEDLEANDITIDDLMTSKGRSHEFLRGLMEHAADEVGFEPKGAGFMTVQITPFEGDKIAITIGDASSLTVNNIVEGLINSFSAMISGGIEQAKANADSEDDMGSEDFSDETFEPDISDDLEDSNDPDDEADEEDEDEGDVADAAGEAVIDDDGFSTMELEDLARKNDEIEVETPVKSARKKKSKARLFIEFKKLEDIEIFRAKYGKAAVCKLKNAALLYDDTEDVFYIAFVIDADKRMELKKIVRIAGEYFRYFVVDEYYYAKSFEHMKCLVTENAFEYVKNIL